MLRAWTSVRCLTSSMAGSTPRHWPSPASTGMWRRSSSCKLCSTLPGEWRRVRARHQAVIKRSLIRDSQFDEIYTRTTDNRRMRHDLLSDLSSSWAGLNKIADTHQDYRFSIRCTMQCNLYESLGRWMMKFLGWKMFAEMVTVTRPSCGI